CIRDDIATCLERVDQRVETGAGTSHHLQQLRGGHTLRVGGEGLQDCQGPVRRRYAAALVIRHGARIAPGPLVRTSVQYSGQFEIRSAQWVVWRRRYAAATDMLLAQETTTTTTPL